MIINTICTMMTSCLAYMMKSLNGLYIGRFLRRSHVVQMKSFVYQLSLKDAIYMSLENTIPINQCERVVCKELRAYRME